MEDPTLEPQRRAAAYWNVDGLPELYVGFVWLLIPLYLYGVEHLARSSPWYKVLIIGGTLTWMAAIFAGKWVLGALKSRVTYPRTGYVLCEKPSKAGLWLPLLLLALLLVVPFGPQQMVMPIAGLSFVVISAAVARCAQAKRVYWFGAFMCVLGVALGFTSLGVNAGLALMFGAAGFLSLLSGGWRLRHYLEHA